MFLLLTLWVILFFNLQIHLSFGDSDTLVVETFDVFLASSNRFLLQSCIVHKKLISKLPTIGNGLMFIVLCMFIYMVYL
jgi:hypothetical protein